jgi:SAM-dependent methyltransferase
MGMGAKGTEGYGQEADNLVAQYEEMTFADVHRDTRHLLPKPSAVILDIGAGTGRDAAYLAGKGYQVVAVEPTPELRHHGMRLHADVAIEWIDDSLPELKILQQNPRRFDAILMTAVLMHLDEGERRTAMGSIAPLLAAQGVFILSLRYGPVPPGRRMFAVPPSEIIALATAQGLTVIHQNDREDMKSRPDVSWTYLAFRR